MDVGHVSVEATVIAAKPTAKTALKAASKPITASEESIPNRLSVSALQMKNDNPAKFQAKFGFIFVKQTKRHCDFLVRTDQTNATEAIHDKGGQHQSTMARWMINCVWKYNRKEAVNEPGQEGEFTDEVFQKNVIQMDVIVKVESAVSVHTAEAVIGHETVLEAVREQVRIDEVRFYDARIAEQGTTRFDPRERHLSNNQIPSIIFMEIQQRNKHLGYLLKSARVKKDVTEDEIVETDISEVAVSVDDVFYGMVELDVDVRDVGQRRCPLFEIVAFEQLHVFGEP